MLLQTCSVIDQVLEPKTYHMEYVLIAMYICHTHMMSLTENVMWKQLWKQNQNFLPFSCNENCDQLYPELQELLMGISPCLLIKSSQNIFNFKERVDLEKAVLPKLECRDAARFTRKFYVAASKERRLQTSQHIQALFYFNSIPFFSKSVQGVCFHSIEEDKFWNFRCCHKIGFSSVDQSYP